MNIQRVVDAVMEFGARYGYTFEHEATYDRMCLVNNAVYIAKYATEKQCESLYGYVPGDNAKKPGQWTATGAQFAVPYVFKTLFSKEPIEFEDLCEAKEVKTAIYLDRNEGLPEGEHNYRFVGRVGNFCPIKPGCGGAELMREGKDKEGNVKYDAVTGTKDFRWLESEMVRELGKEADIDKSYYIKLVDNAVAAISEHGDFEHFAADDPVLPDFPLDDVLPWGRPCGRDHCVGCSHFAMDGDHVECRQGHDISDVAQLYLLDDGDLFNKR